MCNETFLGKHRLGLLRQLCTLCPTGPEQGKLFCVGPYNSCSFGYEGVVVNILQVNTVETFECFLNFKFGVVVTELNSLNVQVQVSMIQINPFPFHKDSIFYFLVVS